MPELPEVEAARRAIEDHCLGRIIKRSIIADDSKVIDGVSPSDFEASLQGKTIVAAHRKGKNMWLQLDSPPFPSFQFGMAGAIYIKGVAVTKYKRSAVNEKDEWPSKFSKLFIELDDGLELSFTDKRRLAKVRLLENPASAPPISELGPDALLEPMTKDELFNSLSKKRKEIKALLLDQSFISGVGNWIADEVLYQARIHPLQTAASISKESCAALHKCIEEVIEKAVEVGADNSQFPSSWIFHSREKKPGKAFVDGKKIEFITAGGRTTAYVPELQKLSGAQATKAPGKPRKATTKPTKDEHGSTDADESEKEEEENAKSIKSGGRNTSKSKAKKPPARRKSDGRNHESDEAGNDDGHQEEQTKGGKKPPAKRKSKESEEVRGHQNKGTFVDKKKTPARRKSEESDDENDDESDDNDNDEDDRDQKKVTKRKQSVAEMKSKKKVQTIQTVKRPKKRAK